MKKELKKLEEENERLSKATKQVKSGGLNVLAERRVIGERESIEEKRFRSRSTFTVFKWKNKSREVQHKYVLTP